MRFSQNFLFLAPNRSHLPVAWYTRLRIGAIFRLWHQNWCHFREWDFRCGIKIDAILITSSLIPSRLSHLARVIFKKNYFLYLFPVGSDEIEGVFQKFFLTYSQWTKPFIKVFLKKPSKILLLRGNPVIAPSLTPCLKAILWTPQKDFFT